MNPGILPLLACPRCPEATLSLQADQQCEDGRILSGNLLCSGCRLTYPIRRGIPRFLEGYPLPEGEKATAKNFGEAWQIYARTQPNPYSEPQFLEWILPLSPPDFKGKTVLDLGSGLGGFMTYAAEYGPQHIVGLEISNAIEATDWMKQHVNLSLVQGDIMHPPFQKNAFDLIYSIGVLHHLEEPATGFRAAAPCVKQGGRFFTWVYGRENNDFVVYVVDPLRKLASKLPVPVVRSVLAFPLSLVLFPLLHTIYHPSLKGLFGKLPYYDYFQWLRQYGFRYTHGMITDQLIPPRTHYHRQQEVMEWFREAGFRMESITQRNNMSWRALGCKE